MTTSVTEEDVFEYLDCFLKTGCLDSSDRKSMLTASVEKTVTTEQRAKIEAEETSNQVDGVNLLPSSGKQVTLRELFRLFPEKKRDYAAKASKRLREKKKREREHFIARNKYLEEEQVSLQRHISELSKELRELEALKSDRTTRAHTSSLMAENMLLKQEVKRRRIIIQQVETLFKQVHFTADNDKELFCLSKLGVKSAVSTILNACYSSLESGNCEWKAVPYYFRRDSFLKQSKYFSNFQDLKVKLLKEPGDPEKKISPSFTLRMDFIGIPHSEKIVEEAIWKFCSRNDEYSMVKMFESMYNNEKGTAEVEFSQLNLDLEKMALTDEQTPGVQVDEAPRKRSKTSKRWNLKDGKKQIVLNSVLEHSDNQKGPMNQNFDGSILISANGSEEVDVFGLNLHANESLQETSYTSPCQKQLRHVEVPVITTSMICPAMFMKNRSEQFVSSLIAEQLDQRAWISAFCAGFILHNLEKKEKSCDLTFIITARVNDSVSEFMESNLTNFAADDTVNSTDISNAPLLIYAAYRGLDKAMEEAYRNSDS